MNGNGALNIKPRAALLSTAGALWLVSVAPAYAQDNAVQQQDPAPASAGAAEDDASNRGALSSINPDIVITGKRRAIGGGAMNVVELPRGASIIGESFIKDQAPGANPFQLLSLAPGINTNSQGSTGLEPSSISIRGFQSNQLGVSLDGVPINDSGNYATYPQEYVDTENLSQIFVLQGAGDAETPNISATGGVIGMTLRRPSADFHVTLIQSVGSNNFTRSYGRVDTGDKNGNRAFIAYSHSQADQWRGSGSSKRDHIDAMFEHETSSGNIFSIGAYYNRAFSNFYQAVTKAQVAQFGYDVNFAPTFEPLPAPDGSTAQNADNSATAGGQFQRAGYYKLNANPFSNLILTTKAGLRLSDTIHFDIQPYLWVGHGNGGFGTYLSESNSAVLGAPRDLNGDGDTRDNKLYYGAYSQNQYRPGVVSRLKVTTGAQEIILGLHYERAYLREWQQLVPVTPNGVPESYWGGTRFEPTRADGSRVRFQDQNTVTQTIRPFLQDVIRLADDRLLITLGAQLPIVTRDGTNYLPLGLRTSNGLSAPVDTHTNQSKFIANGGVSYKLTPEHTVFASLAQTFRANDNGPLFSPGTNIAGLMPESALDAELGYRYTGSILTGSVTLYHIDYHNRQQFLYDVTINNTVSKNVGDVRLHGVEAEIGTVPIHNISFYLSGSYNKSELLADLPIGVFGNTANSLLPTKGRNLTDVPRMTGAAQLRYDDGSVFALVQVKYTGLRYSTLVNDEQISGFALANLSAGYTLPRDWFHGAKIQASVNVDNLLDRKYYGSINFGTNAATVNGIPANNASYFFGSPRTFAFRLRAEL
jgi:iron complex outermembrane receptor protein